MEAQALSCYSAKQVIEARLQAMRSPISGVADLKRVTTGE
jgi:hypothetical protein